MVSVRADVSCVDLFCGAGGLTYGFAQEGLQVNAGIDLDPACRFPFSSNNDATFIERDISEVDGSEILKLFSQNTIWVLAGCAPCQPFSTYSQRYDMRSDRKWRLLYEFERIIEDVMPDIVTIENVPTIMRHKVFSDFVEALKKLGYMLWFDVVDCAAYGVPQTRKRIVVLASLHGTIGLIEPTKDEAKYRTVRQAIGRLRAISAGESDRKDKMHVSSTLSTKNMARIRASKPGGTWRDWPRYLVANCHRVCTGRTYPSVYGRMEWDKPAPTITTQCYGFGNGRFGHPEQDRAISLREAAILQGFPKSYKFVQQCEEVYFERVGRLIGNAVPVDLGRAIAKSIIRHIDEKNVRPKHSSRKMKRIIMQSKTGDLIEENVDSKGKMKAKSRILTRSDIMKRVKNKDSHAELALRSALHEEGLRFRLHRCIEGIIVDILFSSPRVAVFVDGCFWHGCPKHATYPKTNKDYWLPKLDENKKRDERQTNLLHQLGWKVIRVWEHEDPKLAAENIARIVRNKNQNGDG